MHAQAKKSFNMILVKSKDAIVFERPVIWSYFTW